MVLLGALVLLLAGCGGNGDDPAGGDAGGAPDLAADAGPDDAGLDAPDAPAGPVSYPTHILPLFERTGCLVCHSQAVAKGGHSLDTLDALLTTGPHAPVVVPCDPDVSVLVQKLEGAPFGDQMPQGGPYYEAADLELVRSWIEAGADGDCENPPPPIPLVEERLFRVSSRAGLLAESVALPEGSQGSSALYPVEARPEFGYVGAGGRWLRVARDGEVDPVEPGWDGDSDLGVIRGVAQLPGGPFLVASQIGLLYLAQGQLWPSPVSLVLDAAVTGLVADTRTDPARPSIWRATSGGLYQLVDDTLYEIRPGPQTPGPVGALSLGPDPQDGARAAVWASFGERVYAVRPDDDGVMAYTFEVAFEDPVIDIASDSLGHVWVVTSRGLFLRRPAGVLGIAPWIHWVLPDGQRAVAVATHRDGATWVLTDAAVYRALDAEFRWQLALGAPASDVVGMDVGDQGSVWLTRARELVHLSPSPTVGVVGIAPGETLDVFPDVSAHPSFPDQVSHVSITVDECPPVTFEQAPYVVTGGALVWRDCLAAGVHTLAVQVDYDGLESALASVGFGWVERAEQITWRGHIEPQIYMRSCARPGCHIDGFAPDGYDAWVEKIGPIIQRTDPATVQGRMPPNGARLTEAERLLIQWWRDDGFLVE